MKKITLTLIIIGALILISLISSFSYQLGKKQIKAVSVPEVTLLEKSKVIQSQRATAQGEVKEIKLAERSITLAAEGDTLSIPIGEDAQVIALILSKKDSPPEPKEIELKDVKVGDRVSIQIEILPAGKFEGRSVSVLPVIPQ